MCDDERRDGLQILTEATFCLKSLPKFGIPDKLHDAGRNTAGDVNAPGGSESKSNIACERSEERAKRPERIATKLTLAGKRVFRYLGRA
jgi:hypothetical protein